jgi:hypothetical protein
MKHGAEFVSRRLRTNVFARELLFEQVFDERGFSLLKKKKKTKKKLFLFFVIISWTNSRILAKKEHSRLGFKVTIMHQGRMEIWKFVEFFNRFNFLVVDALQASHNGIDAL